MQAQAHRTAVRLEIQKLNELPALSLVAQRFLAAVQDNRMEVRQLAAILEQDPGLLARLIGVANSAYYGYPEKVLTAEDAIFKVLGVNAAKSLALSIVLAGVFDARRCPRFPVDRYWEGAVSVAILAQRLASHVTVEPAPSAGEAYLAGLLHSIGKLALVHLFPGPMGEVFAEECQCAAELLARERALVGTDHCEVGAWLGRKWHLPTCVITVIEHLMDDSWAGPHRPLVVLTRAARDWVDAVQHGRSMLPDLAPLGVDQEQVRRACEEMEQQRPRILALSQTLAHG